MAQSYQDGSCKLSTLDQLMPRIYSTMFLVYETDQYENAVKTLNEGLAKATSVLPYLRGSVHKSDDPRNQLTLSWSPQDPAPTVAETPAPESLPSFEQLKQDNGPLSVFQDALAPVPALINYQVPGTKVPTFVIGVTRLEGGLIMSLCAHHVVMDGAGMGLFLKLWGDCIRGEPSGADGKAPFDAGEVHHRESWLREASGFSKNEPKATLEELLRQHPEFSLRSIPSSMPATVPSQPTKYAAKIFAFSSAKLQEAKQAISGAVPAKSLTINNVLGATLWLSITRIRLERMRRNGPAPAADSTTKLGFAINARSRLGPAVSSKSFLGNVTMLKVVEFPATKLENIAGNALANPSSADLPLMEPVISAMAAATAAVTPTHVSEMIAFAERIGDFEEIGPGWNSFHLDLSYTSWANLGMYDADFGPSLGGKPRFVRIPYMPYIDGMVLALPRRGPADGEAVERIEVALMLNEEDMRALEEDEILRSWSV
ncbi:hypothetical protein F5Y13DRAFT_171514 [Hypoxylon sp. FL1857]|nr:hypothetical protein F5Y13DRAFT_171514 [Hypoxylon sp. FL1857]